MESESKNKNEQEMLTLFLQYERLVVKVWQDKFKWFKGEKEDLMQCGRLGLWKAIQTYEENSNTKFITFAYHCIKNQMAIYVRKEMKYWKDVDGYEVLNNEGRRVNILDVTPDQSQDFIERLNLDLAWEQWNKNPTLLQQYIKGSTQTNLGKTIGKSQARVSKIIANERKELKEFLK